MHQLCQEIGHAVVLTAFLCISKGSTRPFEIWVEKMWVSLKMTKKSLADEIDLPSGYD